MPIYIVCCPTYWIWLWACSNFQAKFLSNFVTSNHERALDLCFFQSHNCVKFSKFLSPYLKDMHTAESVQCTHPTIIAVAVHAIDRKSYFLIHALCHAVHRFIKWHEHSLTLLHNWILSQILHAVSLACFVCQLISYKNLFLEK